LARAWGSALTSGEFAAIRGVGFEPVGQVLGAAVYGAGSASGYGCPGVTQVSGPEDPGSFGPVVRAMYQARDAAIGRMTDECTQLGGHGVVGVRLSRGLFPVGSIPLGGLEFTALGTAVRAAGAARTDARWGASGGRPFTCNLSGQDFAKLIMAGWVPAGLALGISIGARHDDRQTNRQARWGSGNAEIAGWTELVNQSRHDARHQLETDVARFGAEGVVIADIQMTVRERDCPVTVGRRDHVVEATLVGTAIARFSRAEPPHARPAPRTVMSLGSS
jgi:uncharacterized protein YbjQ (UPF0145 family)